MIAIFRPHLKPCAHALAALCLALGSPFAVAQGVFSTVPPPPNLEPLPPPPEPPAGYELDPKLEPTVVNIRPKIGEKGRQEYRLNGKLYMIRVTPEQGTPYFLIDEQGNGSYIRMSPQDSGLRVPMWVIFTF